MKNEEIIVAAKGVRTCFAFNEDANLVKTSLQRHYSELELEAVWPLILKESENVDLEDSLYTVFAIPDNDRLKKYQLLVQVGKLRFSSNEGISKYWAEITKIGQEKNHCFEVEDVVSDILANTESNEGQLPYDSLVLTGDFLIDKKELKALWIFKSGTDKSISEVTVCLGIYIENEKVKLSYDVFEQSERLGFSKKSQKMNAEVKSFVYSFCNFINEREVKIVRRKYSPQNNERRVKRGLLPLPEVSQIIISGNLKRYVHEIENKRKSPGCQFWVKGHYFHFRNKKRYKRLYELDEQGLNVKGYTRVGDVIRRWKKATIKGEGILKKKDYIVK